MDVRGLGVRHSSFRSRSHRSSLPPLVYQFNYLSMLVRSFWAGGWARHGHGSTGDSRFWRFFGVREYFGRIEFSSGGVAY
eukprot:130202-Prorocentrum_minimum.AAC.1